MELESHIQSSGLFTLEEEIDDRRLSKHLFVYGKNPDFKSGYENLVDYIKQVKPEIKFFSFSEQHASVVIPKTNNSHGIKIYYFNDKKKLNETYKTFMNIWQHNHFQDSEVII